jgi:hypothetical protein
MLAKDGLVLCGTLSAGLLELAIVHRMIRADAHLDKKFLGQAERIIADYHLIDKAIRCQIRRERLSRVLATLSDRL